MRIFYVLCKSSVRAYQLVIAPLFISLGVRCRFTPSCSHYALQAIDKHGPIHGVRLGALRVLRCHPYCSGGFDPVP